MFLLANRSLGDNQHTLPNYKSRCWEGIGLGNNGLTVRVIEQMAVLLTVAAEAFA